jgi:pimeloyl-ACP methyl ester carboxylesterase
MTTFQYATVNGLKLFYREAGSKASPTIVLLHGFPSSSHMFRDLIPQLAEQFHVIAPDYVGFGYSDAPDSDKSDYTFDNLAAHIEELLFGVLGLRKFSIYVQDYGAPVGYRIASRHQDAIEGIVVQNGNAYIEGIGAAFDPMKPFWVNRNAETEKPVRDLLKKETTIFQYTHGTKDVSRISPDSYTFDQLFLDRPATTRSNSICSTTINRTSRCTTAGMSSFATNSRRRWLCGARTIPSSLSKVHKRTFGTFQKPNFPARYRPLRARRLRRIHRAADHQVLRLRTERSPLRLHMKHQERMSTMNFPENATVVVVHGAWADGSCWQATVGPLEDRGLNVIAAPIPLTSLSDDAAVLKRTLARAQGPVILAGHAYAGAVIATANDERVKALVYVAALAPDEGETVAQVKDEPHPKAPKFAPDADGFIWMPDEGFANAFAQNATREQLALSKAVQRPISAKSIQEPAPAPAWKTKPTWYLVAEEDRMINPMTQRFMAERMKATVRSFAVDHTPLLTAPGEVVDIILEAAKATLS